ncbi:hypothetical protein AGIG_G9617 [Arapaima gigas]
MICKDNQDSGENFPCRWPLRNRLPREPGERVYLGNILVVLLKEAQQRGICVGCFSSKQHGKSEEAASWKHLKSLLWFPPSPPPFPHPEHVSTGRAKLGAAGFKQQAAHDAFEGIIYNHTDESSDVVRFCAETGLFSSCPGTPSLPRLQCVVVASRGRMCHSRASLVCWVHCCLHGSQGALHGVFIGADCGRQSENGGQEVSMCAWPRGAVPRAGKVPNCPKTAGAPGTRLARRSQGAASTRDDVTRVAVLLVAGLSAHTTQSPKRPRQKGCAVDRLGVGSLCRKTPCSIAGQDEVGIVWRTLWVSRAGSVLLLSIGDWLYATSAYVAQGGEAAEDVLIAAGFCHSTKRV